MLSIFGTLSISFETKQPDNRVRPPGFSMKVFFSEARFFVGQVHGINQDHTWQLRLSPAPLLYLLLPGSYPIAGRLNYARTLSLDTFDLTFHKYCHLSNTNHQSTSSYFATFFSSYFWIGYLVGIYPMTRSLNKQKSTFITKLKLLVKAVGSSL